MNEHGPVISKLLVLVAMVIFILAAFGVSVGDTTPIEFVAAGLAFFAAAHLVP